MSPVAKAVLYGLLLISGVTGIYRYTAKPIWTAHSQWDLSSHVRAVQELFSTEESSLNSNQISPYIPPYLPLAYPLLAGIGEMPWNLARFLWLLMSVLMFAWLIRFTLQQLPDNLSKLAVFLTIISIVLFKGSWLALAAGQMSLPVIFLLVWFYANHEKHKWSALLALAAATLKPTLAAPFFLFLLMRREISKVFTAGGIAFFLHLASTLIFPRGPFGYFDQLMKSLSGFEAIHVNSYLLMGTSGRTDLAPLAAVFGVQGIGLVLLLTAIAIGGLFWLYRKGYKLDDLTLLWLLNILFFLLTYHRAYDLVLLIIMGIPVLWRYQKKLSPLYLVALLPFALPLQFLLQTGLQHLPQITLFWHLLACSVPVALVSMALLIFSNFRSSG